MKIALDLDGVLINLEHSVLKLFDTDPHTFVWPEKEYYIYKILNITQREFWNKIDNAGWQFWADLEPYSWMNDLVDLVKKHDKNFYLLTSPSRNPNCSKGKMRWIHKNFGWSFRNIIFASASIKHYCAAPGRVLIDDKESNIEDWNRMGGTGILFPQPWNTESSLIPNDRVSYISEILDRSF